jgi:hypothetical protein
VRHRACLGEGIERKAGLERERCLGRDGPGKRPVGNVLCVAFQAE